MDTLCDSGMNDRMPSEAESGKGFTPWAVFQREPAGLHCQSSVEGIPAPSLGLGWRLSAAPSDPEGHYLQLGTPQGEGPQPQEANLYA